MMRYTRLPIWTVILFVMVELTVVHACGWVKVPDEFTGAAVDQNGSSGDPIGLQWFYGTGAFAEYARAQVDATLNYSIYCNSKEFSIGCSRQKRWNWTSPENPTGNTFEVNCTATIKSAIATVECSSNLCFGAAEEKSEASISVSSVLNDENKRYACGSQKEAVLHSFYLPGPGSKEQSKQSISVTKGVDWVWTGLFELIESDRTKADVATGDEGSSTTSLNYTASAVLSSLPPEDRPRTVSATNDLSARAYAMSYVSGQGESTESSGSAKIETGTFTLGKY